MKLLGPTLLILGAILNILALFMLIPLGLGLLVAHTVVARHGGELHALAAPGEGCHFLMLLPPPDNGQTTPPHSSSQALSPENPRGATHALPA